jgi:hypothetical protein
LTPAIISILYVFSIQSSQQQQDSQRPKHALAVFLAAKKLKKMQFFLCCVTDEIERGLIVC